MPFRPARIAFGTWIAIGLTCALGLYFTFAAIQGEHGKFKRFQTEADSADLRLELAELKIELATLQRLTRRLSDQYLDLDLLDERARDMLGHLRADEVVIP